MFRLIPLLFAALMIAACTCDKCPAQGFDPNQPIGEHDQHYNEGRVPDMPTSETERYYLSLVTSDNFQNDRRENAVVSWFANDPRLRKIRSQTRWNFYTASNPHYRERLARKWGNAFPIVCLTKADGEIIAHVTAKSMPPNAGELGDILVRGVEAANPKQKFDGQVEGFTPIVSGTGATCPGPVCPPPSQSPPLDSSDVVDEVIPPKPGDDLLVTALGGAVLLLGGGGAAYALRRKPQTVDRFI